MRIVAFIPARYDSTRFPGKPLAMIAGRPMIQHVYQRALACPEISEVCVATDDKRIFEAVQAFHGKAVFTRGEHSTGTDRIAEAAKRMQLESDHVIINIQGDQPIFQPSNIRDLIRPLKEDAAIPMSTLMYRIRDEKEVQDPNHVKVVTDHEGFALFFSRSPIPFFRDPDSDRVYFKHLGFYGYRMDFLQKFATLPRGDLEGAEKLEQLRAMEHGFKIKVVETSWDSIEVDTPADIKRVESLLAQSPRPSINP